ncbi:arginyltransferase [Leptospira perolatii]|uniref:Arginyltransferase n=1 Tax=Leptospira perolatii TaxID=2023191 RepID=A0A2M9ZMI1_9LEPT|nr:arginyltransferase [Leptospira perolatii]PJZ70099.1 arginyltransferase [Leptospira perolatii]PJZ73288.1 arginyltransferase [Leptospira perolatii]
MTFYQTYSRFLNSLPQTNPSFCSYYENRVSVSKGFYASKTMQQEALDFLFRSGFRRSGELYYCPACPTCSHCLSIRIPLSVYKTTRSNRRLLSKNSDLTLSVGDPTIDKENLNLYFRYQLSRHRGSYGYSEMELEQAMRGQMYEGSENSKELRLYLGQSLVGLILLDVGKETLSAVYSFFDPDETDRSLGNFLILRSIVWGQEMGYNEFHLGLYLPNHPKMDYKGRWKPAEILDRKTGEWIDSEVFLQRYFLEKGPSGLRLD